MAVGRMASACALNHGTGRAEIELLAWWNQTPVTGSWIASRFAGAWRRMPRPPFSKAARRPPPTAHPLRPPSRAQSSASIVPYGQDQLPDAATHRRGGGWEKGHAALASRPSACLLLWARRAHGLATEQRRKRQHVAPTPPSHGITRSCLFALSIRSCLHSTSLMCPDAVAG